MTDYIQQICQSFLDTSKAMSYLIVGANGVGKRALIDSVAQKLLGQQAMASGFKILECGLTEEAKKKIQKDILEGRSVEQTSDDDKKNEITVDDVRSAMTFLALKTTLPCKILVISLAEQMNPNAQNALLKTLEEPFEKTLIFLLSENPAKLLPTILSRCQKIYLHPVSLPELVGQIQQQYPDIQNPEIVAELADGLPGIAREICENDGLNLYNRLGCFFIPVRQQNISDVLNFAQETAKDKHQWHLVCFFILKFLNYQAVHHSLDEAQSYITLYTKTESLIRKTDSLYLDKAQVLSDILLNISEHLS